MNNIEHSLKVLQSSRLRKWLGPCSLVLSLFIHSAVWTASFLSALVFGLMGCVQRVISPLANVYYPRIHRVAVIPFDSANPYIPGTVLSDYMVVEILHKSFGLEVIERKDLMKILQEQKLTLTGIVRSEKFSQLGSILGVDAILAGSIQTLETIQSVSGSISVTLKLMEVSTGRILWADTQTISHATWSVREVPEVANALMEKAAKKMAKSMEKSPITWGLNYSEPLQKPYMIRQAKSNQAYVQ